MSTLDELRDALVLAETWMTAALTAEPPMGHAGMIDAVKQARAALARTEVRK